MSPICSFAILLLVLTSRFLAAQRSEARRLLQQSLSVCLWHAWVTPTRFKISKHALHHTIEGCFQFFVTKFHNPEFRDSPRTSALSSASLSTAKFGPIINHILETVQARKLHTGFPLVGYRNWWPWMALNGVMVVILRHFYRIRNIFGPTTWFKLDPYWLQKNVGRRL